MESRMIFVFGNKYFKSERLGAFFCKRKVFLCPVCLKALIEYTNPSDEKVTYRPMQDDESYFDKNIVLFSSKRNFKNHQLKCNFEPDGKTIYLKSEYGVLKLTNNAKNENLIINLGFIFTQMEANSRIAEYYDDWDYLIMKHNKKIIGFAYLNRRGGDQKKVLRYIAILPWFRNRGLGTKFMKSIKDFYKEEIILESPNEILLRIAHKTGFKKFYRPA